MKPRTWFAALVALAFLAGPALAQGDAKKEEPAPKAEVDKKAEADKIDMSEDVIFERLTGLYFEGRGGAFFTLGGSAGYSNAQPFFGFEVGYDITDWFSMQISYTQGYQAANPLKDPLTCTGQPDCSDYHMDFGITFFNLSADFDFVSGRRWALEARLGGGAALIEPSAEPDQGPVDGDVMVGLRGEYYTLLRHFSLGLEVDYILVVPTMINSLAISFSVLYNF